MPDNSRADQCERSRLPFGAHSQERPVHGNPGWRHNEQLCPLSDRYMPATVTEFRRDASFERFRNSFRDGSKLMRAIFGPFVPRSFWGVALALVLVAVLLSTDAFADEQSPADKTQPHTAQDRCQFLLDKVRAIILSLDAEGKITFLNHYGEEFFGYSAKEILGKPMLGTLTPATGFESHDLTSFLDGLRREPNRYAFSVNQNMLRNGEKVWLYWANKGIYDEQDQTKEVLRVGLDITERERRLEVATQELREISTMLQGRAWVQRKKLKEITARIEAISDELERPWTLSKSGDFESVAPPTH